jgi:hypothetical protein
MVIFECDGCGNLKEEDEVWLLGFAGVHIAVSHVRAILQTGAWRIDNDTGVAIEQ